MRIEEQIGANIKDAMRSRDKVKLAALRDVKSKFMLEQSAPGGVGIGGEIPDETTQKELFEKIAKGYTEQTSPVYAASRLWVDAVIDPNTTREWIAQGIEAANHAPLDTPFTVGVMQT